MCDLYKQFVVLFLALVLFACDYRVYWSDKDYKVWRYDAGSIDLHIKVDSHGSFGKLSGVVAAGSNKHYVVAITGSKGAPGYYYYIDKRIDEYESQEGVFGPFTEEEFVALKKSLGLPKFKWRLE